MFIVDPLANNIGQAVASTKWRVFLFLSRVMLEL
jgi:hypothetical protein